MDHVHQSIGAAMVAAACAAVTLACQAVLGIETDRGLDEAYPPGGYEGCTQAPDCSGCTQDSHRCVCEGNDPASCGVDTNPDKVCASVTGSCLKCVCASCDSDYRACSEDPGCFAILDCVVASECDTKLSSTDSCYQAKSCQQIIDSHGGPTGTPYTQLERLMSCASEAGCACSGGGNCSPDNECKGCVDCMATCLCEGNDQTACTTRCNPSSCTPEQGCTGCADCKTECLCQGNSDADCDTRCSPSSCTPEQGCTGCTDCRTECLCQGNSDADCDIRCNPSSCTPEQSCTGCADCIAECQCWGDSYEACLESCTVTTCSPDDACAGCLDCVAWCECSGETYDVCVDACATTSCTPEVGCTGCADCNSVCLCENDTPALCLAECSVDPRCTQTDSCQNCATCFQQCRCQGRTSVTCAAQCATQGGDQCTPIGGCTTCGTCLGKCQCEGNSLTSCLETCGQSTCSSDCASCTSCMDQCACEGSTPSACLQRCLGQSCPDLGLGPCYACGCDTCPEQFGRCWQDSGCRDIVQCMYETGCRGEGCFTAGVCLGVILESGERDNPSAALAEALVQCQDTKSCACSLGPVPASMSCGNATCEPFIPPAPDPYVAACCPDSTNSTCGLILPPQLSGGCQPLGQPGDPDESCPSVASPGFPFPEGATLAGCCRTDGLCGYLDIDLGFGCMKADLFGVASNLTCGITSSM